MNTQEKFQQAKIGLHLFPRVENRIGDFGKAAACYLYMAIDAAYTDVKENLQPPNWPSGLMPWHPEKIGVDLAQAGALLLLEIEDLENRLRATPKPSLKRRLRFAHEDLEEVVFELEFAEARGILERETVPPLPE